MRQQERLVTLSCGGKRARGRANAVRRGIVDFSGCQLARVACAACDQHRSVEKSGRGVTRSRSTKLRSRRNGVEIRIVDINRTERGVSVEAADDQHATVVQQRRRMAGAGGAERRYAGERTVGVVNLNRSDGRARIVAAGEHDSAVPEGRGRVARARVSETTGWRPCVRRRIVDFCRRERTPVRADSAGNEHASVRQQRCCLIHPRLAH